MFILEFSSVLFGSFPIPFDSHGFRCCGNVRWSRLLFGQLRVLLLGSRTAQASLVSSSRSAYCSILRLKHSAQPPEVGHFRNKFRTFQNNLDFSALYLWPCSGDVFLKCQLNCAGTLPPSPRVAAEGKAADRLGTTSSFSVPGDLTNTCSMILMDSGFICYYGIWVLLGFIMIYMRQFDGSSWRSKCGGCEEPRNCSGLDLHRATWLPAPSSEPMGKKRWSDES